LYARRGSSFFGAIEELLETAHLAILRRGFEARFIQPAPSRPVSLIE
jgi:hypothetical protein